LDDIVVVVFMFISLALFILIFKQFKKSNKKAKPTSLTKEDIIDGYEKLVIDLINNNQDSKEVLLEKKSQLLKYISKDLHNNIFFSDEEAKEIVQKLAKL